MPVKHILLIHQGAIGDLIVSLPSFYAIRRAFPDAIVEAMGYPSTLSLINKRFYAETVCSVDRAEMASLYNEQGHVHPDLIAGIERFEKIFIFGGNAQKTAMQNLASLHGPELIHIKTFPAGENKHVIDFQLEQLQALGYDTSMKIPRLFLRAEDFAEAQNFLIRQNLKVTFLPLIAIHPGSGSSKKNWPVDCYAALVHELYRTVRGTILLIEGPADGNSVSQLKSELAGISPVMLQSLELPVLAAILKECTLFIGNDSGITHLAAAMGIPVVAIFGPTDQRIWGPKGEKVKVLKRASKEGAGVQWIRPAAVLEMVLPMLNELPGALIR
jgi:ADP-heptose:LPS heptosyltransferase